MSELQARNFLRTRQRSSTGQRLYRACVILLALAVVSLPVLDAQELTEAPDTPKIADGPPVTVRGIVLNAATGQPLPRALVKIIGNEGMGALTNGEGRFELRGVPSGIQNFDLTKPGFQEQMDVEEGGGFDEGGEGSATHALRVADGMPELSFTLAPKNAIFGHVTLSTGKPAQGIGLTLFRQSTVDGRASWVEMGSHQTTPDGAFRYAGLSEGTYLLLSQPEFDNDRPAEPSCNADAPAEMTGYAPLFYVDAAELAGATRITVTGGRNAEANLSLNLTKFHFVQAAVAHVPVGDNWPLSYTLFDHTGRQVAYQIHKEKDSSLCVYLPDGSYTLAVQAAMEEGVPPSPGSAARNQELPRFLTGLATFTVDGSAERNLRVSLTKSVSTPVNLRYEPAPPQPVKEKKNAVGKDNFANREDEPDASPLVLTATRVNAAAQNEMQARAIPTGDTSYVLETALPGAYWIHAFAELPGICLGSVDAGGQSLVRSPWTAPPSGAGVPIDVVMRTDCGSLTVQMPPALSADSFGASAILYVYVIPGFDSIGGVSRGQLDQFNNRSTTFGDLSPGPYRVFAFRKPHSIEFQSPAALEALGPGQEVTLEPHGSVSVVLKEILK